MKLIINIFTEKRKDRLLLIKEKRGFGSAFFLLLSGEVALKMLADF